MRSLKPASASAPGSLMLMGEHAVLRGYPAIIQSLPECLTVTITPRSDQNLWIQSSLGSLELSFLDLLEQPRSKLDLKQLRPEDFKKFEYVLRTLEHWLSTLNTNPGFSLEITSDFKSSVGLGSSTAVVVATLKALNQANLTPLNPEELFTQSLQIIRSIQGQASGADVAASVYGGCLFYQAETIEILPYLSLIEWKFSGEKVPTREAIAKVNALDADYLEPIFEKIHQSVLNAKSAMLQKDAQKFAQSLIANQKLMEALFLDTPSLKNARLDLAKNPEILATKISGAGLGDGVIGFKGFNKVNNP